MAITGGLPISAMTQRVTMSGTEDFPVRVGTSNFRLNYTTLLSQLTTDLTVSNTLTTVGDILFFDGANARLPIGSEDQFLRVSSGVPVWETVNILSDPTTSNGDIIYRSGAALANLSIGSTGQVLTVGAGGFPEWGTGASYIDPLTTQGDVLYRGASETLRLPIGTQGQVFTVGAGGIPEWAAASSTPLDTDGQILIYNSGEQGLSVGTTGQFLRVDGSNLPAWETVDIFTDPLTTDGDITYRTGGATSRLPIGSVGQLLAVGAGPTPSWSNVSDVVSLGDLIDVSSTVLNPGLSEDEYVLTYDDNTSQYELKPAPGTTYSFENGLSDSGNIVSLGGALLSPTTTIEGAGNSLIFNNLDVGQMVSGATGSHEAELLVNANQTRLRYASVFGSASRLQIDLNPGLGGIVVTDDVFNRGITLAGDYSPNFGNNDLVTRAFVEGLLGDQIPLSGTAQNPGAGQDDYVLFWNHASSVYDLRMESAGGSTITFGTSGQIPFTNGTTDGYNYEPQLSYATGGFLTVGTLTLGPSTITSSGTLLISGATGVDINPASDQNVSLSPSGTGIVVIDGLNWPSSDGTANQFLQTDGAGNLTFAAASAGAITNGNGTTANGSAVDLGGTITSDITIEGGTLPYGFVFGDNDRLNNFNINTTGGGIGISETGGGGINISTSGSGNGVNIEDNGDDGVRLNVLGGTGELRLNNIIYPKADGTANQVLQTNGSGVLSFASVSGSDLQSVMNGGSTATGLTTPVSISTSSTVSVFGGTSLGLESDSITINGAATFSDGSVTFNQGLSSVSAINSTSYTSPSNLTVQPSNGSSLSLQSLSSGGQVFVLADTNLFLTNQNNPIQLSRDGSSVEYIQLGGSTDGGSTREIIAEGSATDIGINLVTKGAGQFTVNGSPISGGSGSPAGTVEGAVQLRNSDGTAFDADNLLFWDSLLNTLNVRQNLSVNGTGSIELSTIPNAVISSVGQLTLDPSNGRIIVEADLELNRSGSASSPTITRTTDNDTGIFFPAANELGIATGGQERINISSTGISTRNATGGAQGDGTINATGLYVNGVAVGGTSGTYTPTATSVINLTTSTGFLHMYTRIGDVVTVSGLISVTATTANSFSVVRISLPVSSNFSDGDDASGVGVWQGAGTSVATAIVSANVANDLLEISFVPTDTALRSLRFTAQYRVI